MIDGHHCLDDHDHDQPHHELGGWQETFLISNKIMIIHIIMTMVVGKEQGKHGGDGHGGREGGENHRWHRDYNDHHHFHSCSRWDAQGQTSCLAAESTRSSPGPNSTSTTIYMAQKKSTQCLVILTRSWLFWFCTSCILIIFHTTIYVCQDRF